MKEIDKQIIIKITSAPLKDYVKILEWQACWYKTATFTRISHKFGHIAG